MDTGFAVNIKGADSLGASPFLVAFDTHWARSRSLSSPGMDLHPPLNRTSRSYWADGPKAIGTLIAVERL